MAYYTNRYGYRASHNRNFANKSTYEYIDTKYKDNAPMPEEFGITESDIIRVKKEYEKLNIKVDVFDFSKAIPLKMQNADFAVSRAGASTLWELCANHLPTFFIPYKHAAADHQYYNAKVLFDKGLCFLKREEELSEDYFFEAINSDIHKISIELISSINPNAISLIVNIILEDSK